MPRILLVDDEIAVLGALSRLLRRAPLTVRGQTSLARVEALSQPELALQRIAEQAYDLIVCDYRMPGIDGVTLLKRAVELQPHGARIILSGQADLGGLVAAINEARIDRFITKPWNDDELVRALAQVLDARAQRVENEALADQVRCDRGELSPTELELKRLEQQEPGITQVHWAPDGSVVIDLDDLPGTPGHDRP